MLRTVVLIVGLTLSASVIQAGVIADSIAYQGRLLDASDAPVSGNFVMILSLWSDSTGGTMLYSEDQNVTVSQGIFSVCVGCVGAGMDDNVLSSSPQIWLQTQIAGQAPMTPRTRFRSTPRAVVSSRVRGDISTAPSAVAIGDLDGDGRLDLRAKPDTAGVSVRKNTASGLIESSLNLIDDRSLLGLKTYQPGQPHYGNITFESSESHSLHSLDCDDDGDGLSDSRVTASAGHGGGGAGGSILIEADLDGDGTAESSSSSSTNDSSASVSVSSRFAAGPRQTTSMDGSFSHARLRCDTDSDNDGVADNSVTSETSSSLAKHAINTKGTGTSGRTISSSTSSTSATVLIEADLDGDGFAENSIGGDCDDTDAEFTVAHEAAHVIQQKSSSSGVSLRIVSDHDQDGLEDRRISQDCDDTDASISIDEPGVHVAITTNPDSTVFDNARYLSDHNIIHRDLAARNILLSSRSRRTATDTASVDIQVDSVNGGRAAMAIKTKGTGAQRVLATASSNGASIETEDDDCDGYMRSSGGVASLAINTKGTGAKRVIGTASSSGASLTTEDEDCDGIMSATGGTARLAIKTKGTSAKRVMAQADTDSASIAIDEPGVHVAMTSKGWDGTIKGRVCVTDGTELKVDFDGDGDGFVSNRFGIGVLDPSNPLEHSSGAHLTAGGVWTNASDENLKENFEPVDGAELLEKIEHLPISEWNYKTESEAVKHIGPTAQDFQATFGVGSDGKSISTIDPSGIALAAIKELKKQNQELHTKSQELSEQNSLLKKQLQDLTRKVEQLLNK